MRYSIRPAALLQCSECLERAARAERREIDELLRVIRQLNGLWGMAGVISQLRKEAQDMEEQVQIALSMAQAARRIHQIYMDMERSITDAADCPFHLEPGSSGCTAPVFPVGSETTESVPPSTANTGGNWELIRLLEKFLIPVYGRKTASAVLEIYTAVK